MKIRLNSEQRKLFKKLIDPALDIDMYSNMMKLTTHKEMAKIKQARADGKVPTVKSAYTTIGNEKEDVLSEQQSRFELHLSVENAAPDNQGFFTINVDDSILTQVISKLLVKNNGSDEKSLIDVIMKQIQNNIIYSNRDMFRVVQSKWNTKDENGKEIDTATIIGGGEF